MADENEVGCLVERLKGLLLQATPIWIEGIDFFAFNFGDKAQSHSMAGYPSKITGESGSAVIDRATGHWRFGKPNVPIVNVSHVDTFERARLELTFDQVKKAITDQR